MRMKKGLKELLKCYNINDVGNIALFIGPEGGFAHEEADEMSQSGIITAGLGGRIPRTETALDQVFPLCMRWVKCNNEQDNICHYR